MRAAKSQVQTPAPTGSPLAPLRKQATPRAVTSKKHGHIRRRLVLDGQYKLRSALGEGAHGEVKLASTVCDGNKEMVAVKTTSAKTRRAAAAVHEAQMQAAVHDHPNIATAFDLVSCKKNVYLVMQLGECDLFDFVLDHGPLRAEQCYPLLAQLVSAVAHMHSRGVAHRDIKPENVLLVNQGTAVVLTDFGCAVEFPPNSKPLSEVSGTARNESGLREYDPMAMDVWGVGVVFFFMLTQLFPFDEEDDQALAAAVVHGRLTNELPPSIPREAVALLNVLQSLPGVGTVA